MNTTPTELEMLIQDERLLQEEIEYEEKNLAELKELMQETKAKIERESVTSEMPRLRKPNILSPYETRVKKSSSNILYLIIAVFLITIALIAVFIYVELVNVASYGGFQQK